ncbi:MAG TPA: hypothetical protein VFQ39_03860, partial [Longimicrobium sp.]|nr:hypothetical protein [Longimicrobium sp.]
SSASRRDPTPAIPSVNAEEDARLHARLVEGDPIASVEVFDRYLTWLIERLSMRGRFRRLATGRPEVIRDAATDAIFAYVERPGSYSPARGTLRSFLAMSARGDLLNALAKERRIREREESYDQNVELGEFAGNIPSEEVRADHRLRAAEIWSRIREVVPDPVEQAVVRLMLDGERSRDEFARILGITTLPDDERNREVDRMKDRIKKRLQRAGRARMGDL